MFIPTSFSPILIVILDRAMGRLLVAPTLRLARSAPAQSRQPLRAPSTCVIIWVIVLVSLSSIAASVLRGVQSLLTISAPLTEASQSPVPAAPTFQRLRKTLVPR